MIQNQMLSPHFSLKEMTDSQTARKYGIANVPSPEAVENLRALCVHTLEPLREALGLPIIITSGFRTKALNDKLAHSSERSQHMQGQAADFYIGQSPVSGSRFATSFSLFARDPFGVQVSGGASKVLGDLNHEVCDSTRTMSSLLEHCRAQADSRETQTGDSPMKLETPRQRLIRAFREILTNPKIDFDQLILYPNFIHVSYVSPKANRRGILKAQGNGKLGYGRLTRADALKIE